MYFNKIGRRKTWLIPTQILIGAFMLFLGKFVDQWMGDGENQKPQMVLLTIVFFCLWFDIHMLLLLQTFSFKFTQKVFNCNAGHMR